MTIYYRSAGDLKLKLKDGEFKMKTVIGAGSAANSVLRLMTLCFVTVLAGCAPTEVQTLMQYNGPLPRPLMVVVKNFSVSPNDVKLDSGVVGKVETLVKGESRTQEEIAIGQAASESFAKNILEQVQDLGIPATRGDQQPVVGGTILEIRGQLVSIDEGNMAEREVIGFGAGRNSVKSYIQVYQVTPENHLLVAEYETTAKSGYKPGLAVTMGAGAIAGHLATSAAVGGTMSVVSEGFLSTVNADADRTAKDLKKKLDLLFEEQGWIM